VRKKVIDEVKLVVPAGGANPAPPVGPILGQRGINIVEFCKLFNERTSKEEKGTPLPVVISVFANKSFSFEIKTPPTSFLLRKAAGLTKGSSAPGKDAPVGSISREKVIEVAKQKIGDMQIDSLESAIESVCGTARSMGLIVVS
jgi:large subunit ribosomal protein L11